MRKGAIGSATRIFDVIDHPLLVGCRRLLFLDHDRSLIKPVVFNDADGAAPKGGDGEDAR